MHAASRNVARSLITLQKTDKTNVSNFFLIEFMDELNAAIIWSLSHKCTSREFSYELELNDYFEIHKRITIIDMRHPHV